MPLIEAQHTKISIQTSGNREIFLTIPFHAIASSSYNSKINDAQLSIFYVSLSTKPTYFANVTLNLYHHVTCLSSTTSTIQDIRLIDNSVIYPNKFYFNNHDQSSQQLIRSFVVSISTPGCFFVCHTDA
jgi:hypothetical protein